MTGLKGFRGQPPKTARNEEILAAVKAGEKYPAIAARYGVSDKRIGAIARRAGIVRHHPLSAADTERILHLDRQGRGIMAIMREVKRKRETVVAVLEKHGRYTRKSNKVWTNKEEAILRAEYRPGNIRNLMQKLGRSKNSVIGKAAKLGLCQPLPPPEQTKTAEIGRRLQSGEHPEEIAWHMNIAPSQVYTAKRRLRESGRLDAN